MATEEQQNAQNIYAALKSGRTALVSTGIFSFIINLLMLTGPLFMLQVYDRVLNSGSISTLTALVLLAATLYILYGFLEFIRSRVMVQVGRQLDEGLRARAFDMMGFHATKGNPQVRNSPISDLLTVRQFVSSPGPFAFFDMPWAPIYLFVIYLMHPWLGIAAAIAVVILAVLAVINNRIMKEPSAEAQKAISQAQIMSDESLRNAEVSSVLGMSDVLRNRWESVQSTALDAQTSASNRGGLISSMSRTLRLMFQSGMLGLGALLAVQQEISAGSMIAASIIMARALAPVEQAVAHWQPYLGFRRAWARLSELMKQTPAPEKPMELPEPKGSLEVDGVSAFVADSDKPIVFNVSFKIEAGTGLGVIGPTGAGKSTLARAIVGAWPRMRGKVRLDGAEVRQWDPVRLGKHLGYLPQDVELFEGTVAENISRFEPEADPQNIVAAARQAAVHEMVLKLPDGYNTRVGAGGHRLSAGQLQRIGLARAMYGDPVLLIMDEPNANLDAEGEAALVQAVANARKRGATVIVVAHRPSALAAIDTLLMLKDGKQVAFGPKDEVLAKVLQNGQPKADKRPAAPAAAPKGLQTASTLSIVSDTGNQP
ncbi:type I secretion system permease/ATPase [Anderseniella sp. Alg231-50]|uniref:type I secretion system permease/ATPase n=1 Tax=Anderseniella sp. Alg231-50 TaxID=1922226 RepID=UPI000D54BC03